MQKCYMKFSVREIRLNVKVLPKTIIRRHNMISETIKHFYEELKFLCNEIERLKLPGKFIEAARQQNEEMIEELFSEFKQNNLELWERFSKFYEEYEKENSPIIFDNGGNDEDCYIYNPNEINPVSLSFVLMFSECKINDGEIFWDYCILQAPLRKELPELAYHMENSNLDHVVYDLLRAFKPE